MRRGWGGIALLMMILLLVGCQSGGGVAPSFTGGQKRIRVAASFYPVYEFVRQVGGDKVDAVNFVPAGVEPHDWEPTAGHLKTLSQANLFVYSGAGMEHWVDKTLHSLDNKRLVTVEASRGFVLIAAADEGEGSGPDPHVWLDPRGAIHEVEAIRDGLIQVDPANRAVYEANAAQYIASLKQLDTDYQTGLSGCREQRFFTSHAAFGYLARRYGLTQHAIMGLAPDAEPTPGDLARIVEQAKQERIKYIFFETLVSDKVAKLVAQEAGAQTLALNPLEGLTESDGKTGRNYLSVMRENLANLKIALECGK